MAYYADDEQFHIILAHGEATVQTHGQDTLSLLAPTHAGRQSLMVERQPRMVQRQPRTARMVEAQQQAPTSAAMEQEQHVLVSNLEHEQSVLVLETQVRPKRKKNVALTSPGMGLEIQGEQPRLHDVLRRPKRKKTSSARYQTMTEVRSLFVHTSRLMGHGMEKAGKAYGRHVLAGGHSHVCT